MVDVRLDLTVESLTAKEKIVFAVQRLVCAGWVGRDKKALQAHIDEMAELGVPGPTRTPIYMNFSPYLVTTAGSVDVISRETSGEVEYVVLRQGGNTYIGVGSDHTDRGFEKHGIAASKQMYAKVIAPVVWPLQEIQDHWDKIIVRSWTTKDGQRALYQDDPLASILDVGSLLKDLPKDDGLPADNMVMFSGTVASKTGLVFGDFFEFEMEDPVLARKVTHTYGVRVLPQYM